MKPETLQKIYSVLTDTAIIGILTALIAMFFQKRIDKKMEKYKYGLQKDIQIFEKEKEALSGVLKCFTDVYTHINELFDFESSSFRPISRDYCNKIEQELSQYLLYVNEQNQRIITLLLRIMKRNDTFIAEATGDEYQCFRSNDLSLFEFIYKKLVIALKNQLFELDNNEIYKELNVLEISFVIDVLIEEKIIERKSVENYMYSILPILKVIENIQNNKMDVILMLQKSIEIIQSKKSLLNYRYNQVVEIGDFIKYLSEIKRRRTTAST